MIGGPFAPRPAHVHVIRKFFSPFVAVPLFHSGEPRPHRIDRVLGVLAKMAKLARKHRRAPAGVHNPTRTHAALLKIDNRIYSLSVRAIQLAAGHFGWTPEIAASLYRELEQMR